MYFLQNKPQNSRHYISTYNQNLLWNLSNGKGKGPELDTAQIALIVLCDFALYRKMSYQYHDINESSLSTSITLTGACICENTI